MQDKILPWLETVRHASLKFIQSHYPGEVSLFDSFWFVVADKISHTIESESDHRLTQQQVDHLTHQALSGAQSLDLVTPIVISTLSTFIYELKQNPCPLVEQERIIAEIAAQHGAKPSLTACLIKHLPALYKDLQTVPETQDALVLNKSEPQYQIWTNGESRIVNDIRPFEKTRQDYLLWVNLASHQCQSKGQSEEKINPQTIKLLLYLVEHLGVQVPAKKVLNDVFDSGFLENSDLNTVEQQITKLNKLCQKQFRSYLFPDRSKGFGLNEDFKGQYFLFRRLR